MTRLPRTYRVVTPKIATYDYTDIEEGTGIQTFYGFAYYNQAGVLVYALGEDSEYSESVETMANAKGETTVAKIIDLDFDLKAFVLPKDIEGTAQVNICHAVSSEEVNSNCESYVICKIRKYSGTTETEIASGQSPTITATDETEKYIRTIRITVPPTHFKEGDVLRLTIEVWGHDVSEAADDMFCTVGHDPENRDGTYIIPTADSPRTITKLIFKCPFRLEV